MRLGVRTGSAISWQKDAVVPMPGRTSIYRALVRNGLAVPGAAEAAAGGLSAVGTGPANGVVADGCGRRLPPGRRDWS